MSTFLFGHDDVAEVKFNYHKLPKGRFTIDSYGIQNTSRPAVGDQGLCVGGYWEQWATYADKITIDLDKYRAWLKTIPTNVKWLLLDIEANKGEFAYSPGPWDANPADYRPNERTTRAFRLLHSVARQERPELNLSLYCEGGIMPHQFFADRGMVYLEDEPINSPLHAVYKARLERLTYGIPGSLKTLSSAPKKNGAQGVFDANELIAGVFYLNGTETKDQIARRCDWMAKTLGNVRVSGQKIGCWVSPMGAGRDNPVGANWNHPLPMELVAHQAACFRRSGMDALILWGYQSDTSNLDEAGNRIDIAEDAREKKRQQTWNTIWRPVLETMQSSFV